MLFKNLNIAMFIYLNILKHIMATKTITVTEDAYDALKSMKSSSESFSGAILRIAKRKPLGSFFGILGKDSGKKFENAIIELRKKRNESHSLRMRKIISEMKGP